MSDTTFTNGVTLTDADWFNDVNRLHYTIFSDPATVGAARTNLGAIQNCFGGRLTLATATPVMTSDQTAKTTIYYTPYSGNVILIYDGTYMVPTAFTELSQATTDSTKSPAAVTTNSNYDLFVWNDSGTIRCTRGPAWSSDTARGTGAGTTELELVKGVYLNKVAISNGPAANRGTYVGTVRSNGSSQIDWKLGLTPAAGGSAGFLGVWNMYNRVNVTACALDSTDTWSYSTNSYRQSNNSASNQVGVVLGLDEDALRVFAQNQAGNNSGSEQSQASGIGVDSATVNSATLTIGGLSPASGNAGGFPRSEYVAHPGIGYHYFAWLEKAPASGTTTWYGDGGGVLQNGIYAQVNA